MTNSILLASFLLVLATNSVLAAEPVTGHEWVNSFSGAQRNTFMMAFVEGYRTGFGDGNRLGEMTMLVSAKNEACGVNGSTSICQKWQDKIASTEYTYPPAFTKAVGYYVDEVNNFYQAYPLCKGKGLRGMMQQFMWVWASPVKGSVIGAWSYERIGEDCSK